jgi:hypothetical protein
VYKKGFDKLSSKGFKPKLNVMDSQATKFIKKFLTEEECKLQLVEPQNHRVNAAKCHPDIQECLYCCIGYN